MDSYMCRAATLRRSSALLALAVCLHAQEVEWRQVGPLVVDSGLAGPAGGPVRRVWYSPDGAILHALLANGKALQTNDFETWLPSAAQPPAAQAIRIQPSQVSFRGKSLLGGDLADAAVSPRDGEELAVATASGVWRSLDGGGSWAGLNDTLPNLPGEKILAAGKQVKILASTGATLAWDPANRGGWSPASHDDRAREELIRRLSQGLTEPLSTAVEVDARTAIVAIRDRILRTSNGGLFWDDATSNLIAGAVHGVAADLESGAIYAATANGLWVTYADLRAAGPAGQWTRVGGNLPVAPVLDVRLDDPGNQIYVLTEGYGVHAAMAPHRFRDPRVVNALDRSARAAAPGSLLSVLGAKLTSARSGSVEFPILAASPAETQFQVPFGVTGTSLSLALTDERARRREVQVPLRTASPAIFLDQDGAPMILDADRGVLVDPGVAVHAGSRIQILATGLGRVTPDWPTGLPAPATNSPRVNAPVRVLIDRVPAAVTRATLAPGYVGFYLIEVRIPDVVNNGPAELYIEAGGQQSGRVTLQLVQ